MNIRVDLNTPINDGTEVVFRSPVDCSQITGLIVYYQNGGNTLSKEFAFADAHGNNVGDIDHLFAENVVVKVILDVTAGMAFVQNADTNAYLEWRFKDTIDKLSPAFTATGAIVTCEPVEGYPLEVVAHGGFAEVAKLSADVANSTSAVQYTAEAGVTYRVDIDSTAEIFDVYVKTVSGQEITVTSTEINGLTASIVFTPPADLNEDILITASNGVSYVDYTIYKAKSATKIFRTGKNLFDFKQTAQKLTYFDGSGIEVKKCGFDIALPAGTYYIAAYEMSDCIINEKPVLRYVYMYFLDVNKTQYKIPSTEHLVVETSQGDPKSFKKQKIVIPEGFTLLVVDALTGQNLERTNAVLQSLNVQIEAGSIATAYEPYQGGEFDPGEEIPGQPGVNYLWADVGEVTVTGRKDPVAIIEKLSSAVTAMLGG